VSSAEFKLRGGAELAALLEAVPRKWGQKVLRNGARAGAVVVQKKAKEKVHRKSGKLARAIKVSSRIDGDLIVARVRVKGGKGSHAFLGPFLEYGVAPHLIQVHDDDLAMTPATTKKGRPLARKTRIGKLNQMVKRGSLVINGTFVGPFVHHPGHPAFPFMRPALDEGGQEAINAIGEYVRSHLSWDELKAPKVQVIEDEE
jgi:HK97 gp10 family phage protein